MSSAQRYRESGVDLDASDRAKQRIQRALASARTPLARGALGAFGGMVRVPDVANPILVMSTDGVGTKVLVAIRAGRHDTVGEDLVNHCVNDVLVHGARPLAFLDYIALAAVDEDLVAALVEGVARGCRAHEMTLAGGETATLPDLYAPGHYDLAGTIVGVVAEESALHASASRAGDVLIGYASNGLHTNGYSLARKIVFDEQRLQIDSKVPDLGETVGEALLSVHRSYAAAILPVLDQIHSLAHITGGGIPGNLNRALAAGCGAIVEANTWSPPPLFAFLEQAGNVSREEMFDVFNMGVGMIAVVPNASVERVRACAEGERIPSWIIGEVVQGQGVQII